MKCPKCGTEIKEGYLYCQSCGEEIRIVPDYEPEIFDSLTESIAAIGDAYEANGGIPAEIGESLPEGEEPLLGGEISADTREMPPLRETEETEDVPEEEEGPQERSEPEEVEPERQRKIKASPKKKTEEDRKRWAMLQLALVLLAGAAFLSAFMVAIIRFNRYFDFDRQYAEALSLHDSGDYEGSISVARHALSIDGTEDKTRLLIADDYYDLEKYDESNAILFAMLDDGTGEDLTVYEKIIENYMAVQDYPAIVSLLDNSEDPRLKERYSMYYAKEPVFSKESGEYEEDFELSISSDAPGVIYYTTDGSEPDKSSMVYHSPLPVTEGEITVSAIFVNEFGISSDSVTKTYMVDYPVARPPVLLTESGTYEIPKMVAVDYPENYVVYYTTNGNDPDPESRVFERALDMPLGSSEFRFVAYDDRGRRSEVVVGTYKLNMVCYIDKETALNAIKIQLMSKGENSLLNEYKCSYGYGDGKNSYYLIDEYTYAGSRTGRRFAVDTKAGSLYEASFSSSKQDYVLTPI